MSLDGITFSGTIRSGGVVLWGNDFVAGSTISNMNFFTAEISGDVCTFTYTGSVVVAFGNASFVLSDNGNFGLAIGGFTLITNMTGLVPPDFTSDADNVVVDVNGVWSAPMSVSFRIEVTPSDIDLAWTHVAENTPGAIVGAISAIDLNDADTVDIYAMDVRFEVVNGMLKLVDGAALDFDDATFFEIELVAEDSYGLEYHETVTIEVDDIVETFYATRKNNKIEGTSGADIMRGRAGDDVLNGLAGDDNLRSIIGDDRFIGGTGSDTFIYGTGSDRDTIVDFETGIDKIDLSGWAANDTFREVKRHADNHGQDLWIEGGRGDVLIIKNFSKAELVATDFIF